MGNSILQCLVWHQICRLSATAARGFKKHQNCELLYAYLIKSGYVFVNLSVGSKLLDIFHLQVHLSERLVNQVVPGQFQMLGFRPFFPALTVTSCDQALNGKFRRLSPKILIKAKYLLFAI